jgi:hypothetical protein
MWVVKGNLRVILERGNLITRNNRTNEVLQRMYVYLPQELVTEAQAENQTTDALGDLVDEELASTAHAVEAAALRIQEMLRKSREDDTGVKLEVNERVLDSCTGLMKAIKILIARSKDLQAEIVGEGMVSG